MVVFEPRWPSLEPAEAAALRVHARDHRRRDLPPAGRTLEAHYGQFVLSQASPGPEASARLALRTDYGPSARPVRVDGHEGRLYELGPELPADDPDGRSPAVVTWCDGPMHYLLASVTLEADHLLRIAESMYS